ncbi:phosphatase PAP2 family protein [Pseudonocardia pini]|uniref:phosphatase PAP2 family protein n=1 Tax=Pseudonocardia pini TaxID=2758030 RepID=UPI0015F0CFCE|nr:phosphatase PAP2 family protein [Pseudonocardia pini]
MTTAGRPAPPVLPRHLRTPALVAVLLATVVFVVLAARYAGASGYGRVDGHAETLVDGATSAHLWLLQRLSLLGSPPLVVLAAFVLCGICLALGRRRLAVVAIVGPGLTGLATTLLKPAIGRTMEFGGFAYPSGHTGGATSIALVVALLVVGLVRPGRTTGIALVVTIALVAGGTIGTALVATGAHYPTDTIGGFCAAVAIVLGSALVLERAAMAWHARRT